MSKSKLTVMADEDLTCTATAAVAFRNVGIPATKPLEEKCGSWGATTEKEAVLGDGGLIGYKRSFTFTFTFLDELPPLFSTLQWSMTEYSINPAAGHDDYVLCKIVRTNGYLVEISSDSDDDYDSGVRTTTKPRTSSISAGFQSWAPPLFLMLINATRVSILIVWSKTR
ncbi:OLC1v1006161C1 [Oldenlandia corymbosa var. corymbosa]|uniref:OLC1v1006161C1 n=1 Tax=Oldenlandia corymbosa var. corymbosa TaxID=529605 RepID=A0AAV1DIT5_OLDCO|nr:OLC1v1006161C1 [Oldenlandia corymbosa var. corymbosa]